MAKKPKGNRRRRRGEGSITQRKNGTWTGYILTSQFENGRRKRRYVSGETYEEVRRKLAKLQSSSDAGTLTDVSDLTVSQHLEHWLEHSVKGSIRDSTFEGYTILVQTHINPALGGLRVASVSELTIEKFVSELSKTSPGNARACLMLLKRAFKKLVPRILSSNPCDSVSKPRRTKPEIKPLSKEEAENLMTRFEGTRVGALYVVAVLSGARVGELLALSWADIDFEAGAISINRTLSCSGKKLRIEPPKSQASRRRILMPKRAMDALQDHRKKMLMEGNAGARTVFCKRDGGILSRQSLHYQFKELLKKHQMPDIRFHDLRHTHATLLFLAGENPKIVSERLGHSKISITLDIYSHVLPSMQEQAKQKLDDMFGKKSG